MDVGLSLWLPGGELAEYRGRTERSTRWSTRRSRSAPSATRCSSAMRSWRLTFDGEVAARPCAPGGRRRDRGHVALDLRFDACTPPIGSDGARRSAPRSAGRDRRRRHRREGPLRAGRRVERLARGRRRAPGVARAHGNRDRSWGPRRWGGPRMWRWFSINVDDDAPPRRHPARHRRGATSTAAGCGTGAGRRASLSGACAPSSPTTALTQRVVHLEVLDKEGAHVPAARRRAARGRHRRGRRHAGQRGPRAVDLRRPEAARTATGYGICEYLHQLDDGGRPVVPVE